mmetsp:Transcript_93264/g.266653  ORF Transcript_93264/g.266653 Transcript_93264/m.266653 type:complete len:208 (-) Transcript_93264:1475-2098(-)
MSRLSLALAPLAPLPTARALTTVISASLNWSCMLSRSTAGPAASAARSGVTVGMCPCAVSMSERSTATPSTGGCCTPGEVAMLISRVWWIFGRCRKHVLRLAYSTSALELMSMNIHILKKPRIKLASPSSPQIPFCESVSKVLLSRSHCMASPISPSSTVALARSFRTSGTALVQHCDLERNGLSQYCSWMVSVYVVASLTPLTASS